MKLALCPSLVLTDENTAGAHGLPVLIKSDGTTDPPTYRPGDLLEFAGHSMPAAYWAKLLGALKREPKDREFVAQFLGLWPQGPQLTDAGEWRDFMTADDLVEAERVGAPQVVQIHWEEMQAPVVEIKVRSTSG